MEKISVAPMTEKTTGGHSDLSQVSFASSQMTESLKKRKNHLNDQIYEISRYVVLTGTILLGLFIACASYLLVESYMDAEHDIKIKESLQKSEAIHGLIAKLQAERGLTCFYLIAEKYDFPFTTVIPGV